VRSGAAVQVANNETIAGLVDYDETSGTVDIGSGKTLTISNTVDFSDNTFSGVISGSGSLMKTGTGTSASTPPTPTPAERRLMVALSISEMSPAWAPAR